MHVKVLSKTHILLILSAAEAQLLGIPATSGCAVILPTHNAEHHARRSYRVRIPPQTFYFASCSPLLDLLERFFRLNHPFPCQLYRLEEGYALTFTPSCCQLFLLCSLASEYGTYLGNSRHTVSFLREHGHLLSSDALREVGPHLVHKACPDDAPPN